MIQQADLSHLRRVTEAEHQSFVLQNKCQSGFLLSAKSGENVVKTLYKAAAAMMGIVLTEYELGLTDRVLKVSVQKGGDHENDTDGGRTAYADEIEAEDMANEARKNKRKMCSIM